MNDHRCVTKYATRWVTLRLAIAALTVATPAIGQATAPSGRCLPASAGPTMPDLLARVRGEVTRSNGSAPRMRAILHEGKRFPAEAVQLVTDSLVCARALKLIRDDLDRASARPRVDEEVAVVSVDGRYIAMTRIHPTTGAGPIWFVFYFNRGFTKVANKSRA